MKKYLIVQIVLENQTQDGQYTKNSWNNIIRFVHAKNEDEAVGRFLRETRNISAVQKLIPQSYLSERLKEIR